MISSATIARPAGPRRAGVIDTWGRPRQTAAVRGIVRPRGPSRGTGPVAAVVVLIVMVVGVGLLGICTILAVPSNSPLKVAASCGLGLLAAIA